MSPKDDKHDWQMPSLREIRQLQGRDAGGTTGLSATQSSKADSHADFWSVKFYPYTEPGVDPVFAICGGKCIFVARPPASKESKMEIIQLILDEEAEADHYACVWSKDLQTGAPLLCVSGHNAGIKIFDVLTGECLRTLAGHGGEINDLVISPTNPSVLASASDDCTVRVWSLDPAHERQPFLAILEGDGHKETVLTLSFHASGRYLLSGGIDHNINLWVLPEFPDENAGTDTPTRIFYPHFSTSEIHVDIVDCVAWYNDFILSKAANEDVIVLWSITNFDSSLPPPSPLTAPTTHDANRETRSAFASCTGSSSALYKRHLQFSIPESEIMFMRFSLLMPRPSLHPVLAFCNTNSKVFFWDLSRLEDYYDTISEFPDPDSFEPPSKHPYLHPIQRRGRAVGAGAVARITKEVSPTESSSSHLTGSDGQPAEKEDGGKVSWDKSREVWQRKYDIGSPLELVEAHTIEIIKGLKVTGRQCAWSTDGKWCVVAGSDGSIALFSRWNDEVVVKKTG